jgi:glycosyltransferase involved in cell wall biosynthesis
VGRLEFRKGLQTLLAAFENIRTQRRCFLVVVGAGSMQAQLKRIATTLDGIILLGQQSFPEVIQWMKSSDVLVLPSLHEPWGLVINEAMACGMAVIASDRVGAVDDLVVDGSNGFVVPAGDCRVLSEAMQKLLLQPELSKTMGEASLGIIGPWTVEREAAIIKSVIHRIQETR